MAEKVTIESPAETPLANRYDVLAGKLTECADNASLFKLAGHADFKAAASTLAPADLRRLRELYAARKNDLDGRAKLEEFDGQVINIVDIGFWHTDKFDNNDGNGVTLTFIPELEPSRIVKSMTSSSIVYRFATNVCTPIPPTATDSVRAHISLIPVRDPERAAKGQKQWQFRLLPTPTRNNGELGSPF